MKRALLLAALPLALGLGAGSASARQTSTGTQVLSNEVSLTRWTHAETRTAVHTKPSDQAPIVARLHYMTEDLRPEVYLVLLQRSEGQTIWVKLRLPMRPNGRTGWVRRSALGTFHAVRTRIVVNEERLRATLYRRGHRIWTSIIGIGAPGTPTPRGHFYVREKLTGYASPFYGPIALGTSDYSTLSEWPRGGVVGIHGTDEPGLLPGRVSHGCIRLPNQAIVRLARLTPIGTPILID